MPNSERKSWLQRLLKSGEKQTRIQIIDPNVKAQILGLAQKNNLTETAVMQGFLRIGMLAEKNTLVSRDQIGFEKSVSLMDEDFAPEQGGKNSRVIAKMTVGINLTNQLTEIANRHGISIEEVLTRICKLGIRIAQTKNNPDITYMLRIPGEDDVGFKNADLFG
ncbi:MAG: hypothetical protein HY425_00185 [Candidatus Levybacteria bacterium]|nr:hypothetical protein [Candidatus Levybacteria bacterium]